MAREGDWRRRSRLAIERALRDAPPEALATEAQLRKYLRDFYPFVERENYVYKAWLAELKRQMTSRFGAAARKAEAPPVVAYSKKLLDEGAKVWLTVQCGWCNGRTPGGCMMCFKLHQRVAEVVEDPTFTQLCVCGGDPAASAVLGDWLEENLQDRCGL